MWDSVVPSPWAHHGIPGLGPVATPSGSHPRTPPRTRHASTDDMVPPPRMPGVDRPFGSGGGATRRRRSDERGLSRLQIWRFPEHPDRGEAREQAVVERWILVGIALGSER